MRYYIINNEETKIDEPSHGYKKLKTAQKQWEQGSNKFKKKIVNSDHPAVIKIQAEEERKLQASFRLVDEISSLRHDDPRMSYEQAYDCAINYLIDYEDYEIEDFDLF